MTAPGQKRSFVQPATALDERVVQSDFGRLCGEPAVQCQIIAHFCGQCGTTMALTDRANICEIRWTLQCRGRRRFAPTVDGHYHTCFVFEPETRQSAKRPASDKADERINVALPNLSMSTPNNKGAAACAMRAGAPRMPSR
jgi:hypothetical protein